MGIPISERRQIENEMIFRRANEKIGVDLDEIDALHVADGNPRLVRSDDLNLDFKCECSDENCDARIKMKHDVKPIEKGALTESNYYVVVKKNNSTAEPGDTLNVTCIDNSSN